jgi:hypothetical protein
MNIADSMKEHPVSDDRVMLRDRLQTELEEKRAMTARLQAEIELKHAYILGMMEGNPDIAPSAEMLESLIRTS